MVCIKKNIVFEGKQGKMVYPQGDIYIGDTLFLLEENGIPRNMDAIYDIDNKWAGEYLCVKGNQYILATCGSGVTISSGIIDPNVYLMN